MSEANIRIPVDLTNPGQYFACCGMCELAGRSDEQAEAWFEGGEFKIRTSSSFGEQMETLREISLNNTMSAEQNARLLELSKMSKKEREEKGLEDEKKELDGLRRELPILLKTSFDLQIDWFRDELSGGSRFKTWAGQQSVLDIVTAMHSGLHRMESLTECSLWNSIRGGGLPFNFDSNLGGQGSALDIGFSFDPLNASELTRIEGTCKPALEFLAFIGLQRFRPREISRQNRFVYSTWRKPLPLSAAAVAAFQGFRIDESPSYEFRLLYRTKYLKSFLPAIPFQGDLDE